MKESGLDGVMNFMKKAQILGECKESRSKCPILLNSIDVVKKVKNSHNLLV